MKLKYIIAAMAATSMAAPAATVLTQASGNANGNYGGQSFAIADSGFALAGDALTGLYDLDTVTFTKGNANTATPVVYLNVYEGASFLGSSTNSFDWTSEGLAQNTTATFDFTGVPGVDGLTDGTVYTFRFSSTAEDGDLIRIRIKPGNSPSNPLNTGTLLNELGAPVDAAYDAQLSVEITPVPEPSSSALLGLGGLVLLLRRRK